MVEGNPFLELMARVRAGDEEAAAELVRTYEPAIRRAARIRLVDTRLQRLFDSTDISQSVFASFFVRAALGQYDLDKPERLLNLLINMSKKKLADHAREQGAARRDFKRQRAGQETKRLAAAGASPSQYVATAELVQKFRKRLAPDELDLANLRAQGRTWDDIAAARGGTPEGLRKKLMRAVDRVAEELGLEELSHG